MPTLSKDDWIEIAEAIATRHAQLEDYARQEVNPREKAIYAGWIAHLATILETIGDDGHAMWPKEERSL